MKITISYKYRIYPNNYQKEAIINHINICRYIYNWGLERKIRTYKENRKGISFFDLSKELTQLKKKEIWLSSVNAQSLQSSLRRLENAFTNFFKKRAKFPKFKSKKNEIQTYVCPQGVEIKNNRIRLPKIGWIKVKIDRQLDGKLITTWVKKTNTNKYYIIMSAEKEIFPIKKLIKEETTIGIDLGLKHFITSSDGKKIENPKYLEKSLKKLKKLSKKHSRKQKGSNNKEKSKHKLSLLYEKITNQRNDFLHKLSRQLINESQVDSFVLENLNIEGMKKSRFLARNISSASWCTFKQFLTYKTKEIGKNIITIGRFEPSSKICSNCGYVNHDLKLKDRQWVCSDCGIKHDRDINAAINIKQIGLDQSKFTLEEISSLEESMNQETL